MSDTCLICIENYGLGRRAIKCKYCNYQACEKCVCNYLLVRNEDPHCMECKKEWDYEYLLLTLDKKFIDGPLKSHREDVLYDRERALLPATQVKMASDKLAKARIEELKKIKRQMEEEFYSKIRAIDNEITELKGGKKRFNQVFIRKCPLDGCRGFLSHTWVCGLCEKSICSKCYNLKNDDHECKPDELETARLIINETKPCPKCSTLIYKIDGCDQMWCTNCKTGFS